MIDRLKPSQKAQLVKFWELQSKWVLMLLGGIIAAPLVGLLLIRTDQLQSNLQLFGDPAIAGIFGSLLGAIVGGTLAFFAAIYSQKHQTAARGAIVRKNTIYTPLFDELVNVRATLEDNPYPRLFEIGPGKQTALPHPIFGSWERIKSDTRIIQMPHYMANSLEEYTESVLIYRSLRGIAARDVQEKINEIFKRDHNAQFEIKNIGETLLKYIVLGEKPDKQGLSLRQEIESHVSRNASMDIEVDDSMQTEVKLSKQQVDHLSSKIHEQCNKLASVKQFVKAYEESINRLEDLIETLATIIEVISKKYERHRGWY
jgi:5S rRNA maturation endonuclease (ribonuclease M5)/uncharacterized integral membrane protein